MIMIMIMMGLFKLDSLSCLNLGSSIHNIPKLQDHSHVESNINSQRNLSYYTSHDFHNSQDISNNYNETSLCYSL